VASSDLWWISLRYATFGIITLDGIVTEAAPIAKWAEGKKEDHVLAYFRRKGAKITRIEGGSSNGRASGLHPDDRGSTPLPPTEGNDMTRTPERQLRRSAVISAIFLIGAALILVYLVKTTGWLPRGKH
jgi:hypothetical protein